MMLDCPHCYRKVLPRTTGECPICHKDTNETRGTDPSKTRICLTEKSVLPDVCVSCGAFANRRVTVTARGLNTGANDVGGSKGASRIPGLIGLIISLCTSQGRPGKAAMKILLPQCDQCNGVLKLEPDLVDFERYESWFIVHRNFAQSLKQ